MRALDEPIPPGETLYRWISVDDVNGNEVLPHAIDLAQSSVNRAKYWPDPDGAEPLTREKNGLATTSGLLFPSKLDINGVDYEFFSIDWPEEDNDAHAEIRSGRCPCEERPTGDRPEGKKPGSKTGKLTLRTALAEAMTVYKRPVRPD